MEEFTSFSLYAASALTFLNGARAPVDPQVGRVWQQIVIARLPKLRVLDGTSVRAFRSYIAAA